MTISTSSWYICMIGFMEKNKDKDDDDDDDDNDDTWTSIPHCKYYLFLHLTMLPAV
jgi:hypothetical protein